MKHVDPAGAARQRAIGLASRDDAHRVWERLGASPAARQFQVAFSVATGLPLTLIPVTVDECAPAPGSVRRGPFCIEGCMGHRSGAPCLSILQDAEHRANKGVGPVQFQCPAGLRKVIVPVTVGGQHVGNLLAGPFSLEQLNGAKLDRLTTHLKEFKLEGQAERLQFSWQQSPVINKEKLEAVRTLVKVFAEYLTQTGNQLLASEAPRHDSLLQKVETYLNECEDEEVLLEDVARRVSVSRCHFCKLFKKQTGVTFSQYRVRRRLDKAKQLLLDPARRISEAAFAAGFESLPYFNRAFRRHFSCSPSEFRAQNGVHNPGQ